MFFFKQKAIHLCVLNRNVGDNALNLAIKEKLQKMFRVSHMEILNNFFPPQNLKKLQKSNLIVFGGGGLIHSYGPSGNPIERTGTLWQIELEALKALTQKIVLYGVGFNHFYGEKEPLPAMRELFKVLVNKNALISFRNDGSKERFLGYFPEFEPYIKVIPDPGVFFRPTPIKQDEPYVILQIAADRPHFRFGDRFEDFMTLVRSICDRIEQRILLIPHTPDDVKLYRELQKKVKAEILPLKNQANETSEVVGYYAGADFTISTRGHSQILSIGNCVPTFSIATHPKIQGFAEDCQLEEYCFNFSQESIADGIEKFEVFLRQQDKIRTHLKQLNQRFDREIDEFNMQIKNL